MSTKALKKQLMAAIAMVIVAAVALSSATYAWFAQNTKVTATGVNVTATTAQTLLIDTTSFIGYSTVELESATQMPSTGIWPTTDNVGTGALTFKRATDEDMKNVVATGAFKDQYTAALEDTTEDYFSDQIFLKLAGSGQTMTETITVKPAITYTGTGTAKDIQKAIHIAVIESTSKVAVEFDMGNESGTAKELGTLTYNATELSSYMVYVWIDGPDTDCFTANTGALQDYSITLDFEIKGTN